MKLITQIQRAADGEHWNLYVNGVPAVTYESFQVCCNVEEALKQDNPIERFYSEGAEVADAIRKCLQKQGRLG